MAGRPYHHGDLRNALLDAAEALIRERGADGWSLREASARVGVAPSAAYHHFDSRDALVRALADRVVARVGERLSGAAATAHGGQQPLIAVGREYVRWAVEDPAVARVAFAAGRTEPATRISPHPHDVLAAELDRLAAAGGLPASARPGAEFVIWAAMHGLGVLVADGLVRLDSPQAIDREAERVLTAVLTGLAAEPPPSPAWPMPRSAHSEALARSWPPAGPATSAAGSPR
ncbi:MAG: TetR/AcrR family transcriptional regulator [Actinobacteria bacterium]|nr:TetR/AcrR family transcriptional regulator [Actinomycetota bacterium]MBO0786577.1 TetR/AcrR family transcriptional regulator [Actinomycetota bacterium]